MATLPDLDTSAIGIIAFWNALDHGVPEIDPTDVLACPNIDTYTQYDNGVQGTMHLDLHDGSDLPINFRVKGDGWFITWFPRYSVPEPDQIDIVEAWFTNASDPNGYYNLLWDWTDYGNNITPQQSALERAIYTLAQYLDNWAAITYSETDVGYYSYHFSDATGIYQDSEQETGPGASMDGGLSYTSDVSLYYARACATTWTDGSGSDRVGAKFEGIIIVSEYTHEVTYKHVMGSVNILQILESPGVVYRNSGPVDGAARCKISRIVIFG